MVLLSSKGAEKSSRDERVDGKTHPPDAAERAVERADASNLDLASKERAESSRKEA
jgi:hypothetical protein